MGIHSITVVVFAVFMLLGAVVGLETKDTIFASSIVGVGFVLFLSMRVAKQWQNAVVLRLGKFHKLKGPGLFWIIPFVDIVAYWIDLRIITTPFTAEQTLTKDSVPVDVDAVLFWRVVDPKKASLEVENYKDAISWASQTALRDVIGETDLSDVLIGRQNIDKVLCHMIDERTEPWGIKALSVEIRDVKIPTALQDAMSMQAQAERERQARVILADSEEQIASKFKKSSDSYLENPVALHLRAMNILLEGMRQNSTVVIVPSSAVESMGLGAMSGITSIAKEFSNKNGKNNNKIKSK